MGVGRRLIQRRHKLRDDVRDNVPGFNKVEKMDNELNDSPLAYALARKSLRRQGRNFGKDSLDRKLALAWEANVSIARFDFDLGAGTDYGLKVTLLSGTADDLSRGFKAGDKLKVLEKVYPATASMGLITVREGLLGSDLSDGDTISMDDGANGTIVLEFDSNASITGDYAITFTNGDSAEDIANDIALAIATARTAGDLLISASVSESNGNWIIQLTNDTPGTDGNVDITSSLSGDPEDIAIAGMSNGTDESGSVLSGQEYVAVAETNSGNVAAGKVRIVSSTVWRLRDDSGFVTENPDHVRVELGAGARLKNV